MNTYVYNSNLYSELMSFFGHLYSVSI